MYEYYRIFGTIHFVIKTKHMKSLQRKGGLLMLALAFLGTLVIATNKSASAQNIRKDTLPPKSEKKVTDLDEALAEIDQAHAEMERSLKNIDWKKIESDLLQSMKQLDLDLSKMKIDLEKSMKELDAVKIKAEMDASLAKIDWDKIQMELDKVKNIDFEKVKTDLEKMKPTLQKTMKEAQESLEKAKAELKEQKTFLDALEKEGLIGQKGSYTIEHKNGQLIINGKVQDTDVYNRHRRFLEKHKRITIKKTEDRIERNNDDEN